MSINSMVPHSPRSLGDFTNDPLPFPQGLGSEGEIVRASHDEEADLSARLPSQAGSPLLSDPCLLQLVDDRIEAVIGAHVQRTALVYREIRRELAEARATTTEARATTTEARATTAQANRHLDAAEEGIQSCQKSMRSCERLDKRAEEFEAQMLERQQAREREDALLKRRTELCDQLESATTYRPWECARIRRQLRIEFPDFIASVDEYRKEQAQGSGTPPRRAESPAAPRSPSPSRGSPVNSFDRVFQSAPYDPPLPRLGGMAILLARYPSRIPSAVLEEDPVSPSRRNAEPPVTEARPSSSSWFGRWIVGGGLLAALLHARSQSPEPAPEAEEPPRVPPEPSQPVDRVREGDVLPPSDTSATEPPRVPQGRRFDWVGVAMKVAFMALIVLGSAEREYRFFEERPEKSRQPGGDSGASSVRNGCDSPAVPKPPENRPEPTVPPRQQEFPDPEAGWMPFHFRVV